MDAEEMARDVAKELRSRGIWAYTALVAHKPSQLVCTLRFENHPLDQCRGIWTWHAMTNIDFDNLSAIEIADKIQAQEAQRAQEWAGDK